MWEGETELELPGRQPWGVLLAPIPLRAAQRVDWLVSCYGTAEWMLFLLSLFCLWGHSGAWPGTCHSGARSPRSVCTCGCPETLGGACQQRPLVPPTWSRWVPATLSRPCRPTEGLCSFLRLLLPRATLRKVPWDCWVLGGLCLSSAIPGG